MTMRQLVWSIQKAIREQKIPFVIVMPITRETLAHKPDIAELAALAASARMRKLVENRRLYGESASHIEEV